MSYEFSGKLIEKYDTQQITATFKKREFVLEHIEEFNDREMVNHIKFQITQERCNQLDNFNIGAELKVQFNLRGRRWEKDGNVSYFTNLEAWRIEGVNVAEPAAPPPFASEEIPPPDDDDIPF